MTAAARHRAEVRPRYGRIATLGSSVAVVVIAVLGANGALPSSADNPTTGDQPATASDRNVGQVVDRAADSAPDQQTAPPSDPTLDPTPGAGPSEAPDTSGQPDDGLVPVSPSDATLLESALPAGSGTGKRVVFSELQRVWLVTEDEKVRRTYLVSGSVYDNLDPGTFQVYSRDKSAVGIDDSGTMKFFVRFTQGDTGAAIGFHDIPVDNGVAVQTIGQLGTPLSHGCIRQQRDDAVALWKFAPVGTTVVVTA